MSDFFWFSDAQAGSDIRRQSFADGYAQNMARVDDRRVPVDGIVHALMEWRALGRSVRGEV